MLSISALKILVVAKNYIKHEQNRDLPKKKVPKPTFATVINKNIMFSHEVPWTFYYNMGKVPAAASQKLDTVPFNGKKHTVLYIIKMFNRIKTSQSEYCISLSKYLEGDCEP